MAVIPTTASGRKALLFAGIAAVLLAVFLGTSRAPALTEKAQMGLRTDITGIAFNTIVPVSDTDTTVQRITANTINWAYTNWRGMTFGILFGATVLGLLRHLPLERFRYTGIRGALSGMVGGAPLGVCVNCATPISQGLQHSGLRPETVVATMMASPTLNVIVLTLLVSLFTTDLILIKLGVTAAFIAFGVPLIVKLTGASESAGAPRKPSLALPGTIDLGPEWLPVLNALIREWLANFWFILRITLPLMLLAGLLGALLAEAVDVRWLASLEAGPGEYLLIALVGTLLPVPIAFDVILTGSLIGLGLAPGLAMTLMFSLGIFSIFPALVLAREVSLRFAASLVLGVMLTAIAAGMLAQAVFDARAAQEAVTLKVDYEAIAAANLGDQVQRARALCEATGAGSDCLAQVLDARGFGLVDTALCEQLNDAAPDLVATCTTQVSDREAAERATAAGDSSLCTSDGCRALYINLNIAAPDTIELCNALADGQRAACRKRVIDGRARSLRSQAACSVADETELAACRDRVAMVIATEQISLQRCTELGPAPDRFLCAIGVLQARIVSDPAFSCTSVRSNQLQPICQQLVSRHRAIEEGEPGNCNNVAGIVTNDCVARAIATSSQRTRPKPGAGPVRIAAPGLPATSDAAALPVPDWEHIRESSGILVEARAPLHQAAPRAQRFTTLVPDDSGLEHGWQINATDNFEPFLVGKGLAAGDFDQDGWPDLAVGFERGIYLYRNLGGGSFSLVDIVIPDPDFNTFVVALVDLDNDGWLDLFATAYGGKQVMLLNRDGTFTDPVFLSAPGDALAMAVGFADLDHDADLDLVVGNWSYGLERQFRVAGGENYLWVNEGDALRLFPLFVDDPTGPTLSILLADINNDGFGDIITGNDRSIPDQFMLSTGPFTYTQPDKGYIPETSLNTMSYDAADFNNDGQVDLFSSDMNFRDAGGSDYCALADPADQTACRALLRTQLAVDDFEADYCARLDGFERTACTDAMRLAIAVRDNDPSWCEQINPVFTGKRVFCERTTADIPADPPYDVRRFPRQVTSNKLLLGWRQRFIDVTDPIGVPSSFWSWNARALDADQDGFLDIYVGTGYAYGQPVEQSIGPDLRVFPNVFFHSEAGRSFTSVAADWGLDSHANTTTFVLLDADLDGDVDIIEAGHLKGLTLLRNDVAGNHASIELRDSAGNSHCVGCRVTLTTPTGQQQREILASGGFLSYNEPVAHFGLGGDTTITTLTIRWSTGEETTIAGPLPGNRRYRISRIQEPAP